MDAVQAGRDAYARRAWGDAFEAFSSAVAAGASDAGDLERLAWSAVLTGRHAEAIAALERLHQVHVDGGRALPAARAAFWIALRLMSVGEVARASGWLVRARRLVDDAGGDCVEAGYLRIPQVFRCTAAGDYAGAREAAAQAADAALRHGDADLHALARNLEGRALIRQGRLAEGLPLLDEAMVAVTTGDLSPVVTGIVYCSVIAGCQQSFALDRAREWTAALSDWCEAQPQLVSFAGACLVHRSEILQLRGAWNEATVEARRAAARLQGSPDGDAGDGCYQEGELHRLRGDLPEAERCYATASERGRDPQPGLALLRLAQGRGDAAAAATRRALLETRDPLKRTKFLPAHVEISLATGDLVEARRAVDELAALAAGYAMDVLLAIADESSGAVSLAEGEPGAALAALRRAGDTWRRLGAPYRGARVRAALARALLALGDEDGAALEREAARKVFAELGAAPDEAALDAPADPPRARSGPAGPGGLSARELEVLRLVAAGKANKAIGKELFISEKTVDRHVSNILHKLDVPSRAAATAWAYRHGLVG